MEEIWKDIPDFTGYQVSNFGNVRSLKFNGILRKNPKLLSTPKTRLGYNQIGIYKNKRPYHFRVHQLVMLAFVGPCPDGMEICHNNDIKNDNRLENLRYDIPKANKIDERVNNGGTPKKSHLTLSQVREVVFLISNSNLTIPEISKKFGVRTSVINNIKSGKSYNYVSGGIIERKLKSKKLEQVQQIRELYETGQYSQYELASKFNMSISGVCRIVNNNRHVDFNYRSEQLQKQSYISSDVMTIKDATFELGLSRTTIIKLCKSGKLDWLVSNPTNKRSRILIKKTSIEEFKKLQLNCLCPDCACSSTEIGGQNVRCENCGTHFCK